MSSPIELESSLSQLQSSLIVFKSYINVIYGQVYKRALWLNWCGSDTQYENLLGINEVYEHSYWIAELSNSISEFC